VELALLPGIMFEVASMVLEMAPTPE